MPVDNFYRTRTSAASALLTVFTDVLFQASPNEEGKPPLPAPNVYEFVGDPKWNPAFWWNQHNDPSRRVDNNFLASTACFCLVALVLALIAQQPGSLVLPSFGQYRASRASPFISLAEAIAILRQLLRPNPEGHTRAEIACALLAIRSRKIHSPFMPLDAWSIEEIRVACAKVRTIPRPRLEVLIPVTLQLIKLGCASGIPLTFAIGIFLWIPWALTEFLTLLAYEHREVVRWDRVETMCAEWKFEHSWGGLIALWFHIIATCLYYLVATWRTVVATIVFLPGFMCAYRLFVVFVSPEPEVQLDVESQTEKPTPMQRVKRFFRPNYRVNRGLVKNIQFFAVFSAFIIFHIICYDQYDTLRPDWIDWLG